MTIRQRIACWLDPTPERIERELFELTVKAGRRCAHDLAHAIDSDPDADNRKFMRQRLDVWRIIFYPDNGPKNYRARIHQTIHDQESTIETLRKLLKSHNIPDPTESDDIPF